MKMFTKLIIILLFSMVAVGCDLPRTDISNLVRVDIEYPTHNGITTSNSYKMIYEEKPIKEIKKTFENIKWKEKSSIKSNDVEDAKAIFYYRYDLNMPELTVDFLIWHDSTSNTFTIYDISKDLYGSVKADGTLINIFLKQKST